MFLATVISKFRLDVMLFITGARGFTQHNEVYIITMYYYGQGPTVVLQVVAVIHNAVLFSLCPRTADKQYAFIAFP